MNRRHFIYSTAMTSLGFVSLSRCTSNWGEKAQSASVGEGQLEIVPDPKQYLDLPKGFEYRIISRSGNKMSDGLFVPGRPDGMGAFLNEQGQCVLVRNHENSPGSLKHSAFGENDEFLGDVDMGLLYDAGRGKVPALGGTTTVIYDEKTGEVIEEYLSLAGTTRNCAGGVTPWNSWLTCEESVTKADEETVEKDHGYVFDVPAFNKGLADPKPIVGMGRFNHEAVAVDPETHIVYQTEDRPDGLIYRFVPTDKTDLHQGGQLEVLAIKGKKSLDTRNWEGKTVNLNEPMEVAWMPIDDVESPEDDLRFRGYHKGAARFARGEGMWMGDQEVYFACTNGGPKNFGQIFKYDIQDNTLELFAESEDKTVLNMCDNLTVAPNGMLFVCEDNSDLNRIHYINKEGEVKQFAINRSSDSELAGAVFSPSGKTLFVNIQVNGDTVAITGPWENLV
ncbi:MAG: DUF839 domain-containing protein [Cytophagales bacterium]|nr:DUF839 domain-containing protein [Cytophagales bacterium]